MQWIYLLLFSAFLIGAVYYSFGKKKRIVKKARNEPFPPAWSEFLEKEVAFYRDLGATDRTEFEKRIQGFLATVRVIGVGVTLDDETRLLVASSGVAPFFELPFWDYGDLHEIFIYPNNFGADYEPGEDEHILGLVGNSGIINHLMILSKPALVKGFKHPRNQRHVGYHEFAHILDRADGDIDGVPNLFLPKSKINPWLKLVYKEMQRIKDNNSDINPYALIPIDIKIAAYIMTNLIPFRVVKPRCSYGYIYVLRLEWKQIPSRSYTAF